MEETTNKLEQPSFETSNSQCEKSKSDSENGAEFEAGKNGSNINFGKFKSGEELLKAYNLLQSDYTRKCQALAVTEKQLEDKENESKNVPPQEVFEKAKQKQKEFYLLCPDAKEFESVLEEKVKGSDFLNNSNPYLTAWQEYKQENFLSPKKLISDENFLNSYIYNNPTIAGEILRRYFSSLQKEEAPILIASQPGSKTVLSIAKKPKTIEEAGKIASDMFS